jgi:hypothetical protein
VIPSLLIHLGVIDLSASLHPLSSLFTKTSSDENLIPLLAAVREEDIQTKPKGTPKEGPILTADQAYILRAAAIDACELIVQVARSLTVPASRNGESLQWINDITLPELDMWIWAVAKDRPDYRKLERFVQTDTVFF